jgi:hypothetical protein
MGIHCCYVRVSCPLSSSISKELAGQDTRAAVFVAKPVMPRGERKEVR